MADKSAEKERLFNEWFTASYDRLRGTLRRYGMLDEDNFHDTYPFRKKAGAGSRKGHNGL